MPWHEVCEGEEVMLGLLHCSTLTLRPRHLLQEGHTRCTAHVRLSLDPRPNQTQPGPQKGLGMRHRPGREAMTVVQPGRGDSP